MNALKIVIKNMTLTEAYELLDLSPTADIALVRQRFREQYSEYRIQIDNAPTPNLKKRYEDNLALRQEAFNLITGGEHADDTADLPNSTLLNAPGSPKPEESKADSLTESFAALGLTPDAKDNVVKNAYKKQRATLESELNKTKIEAIKTPYLKEIEKLDRAWSILQPHFKKIAEQQSEANSREAVEASTKAHQTKTNNSRNRMPLILVLIIVMLGASAWFYFSRKTNSPTGSLVGSDFNTLILSADSLFAAKKYDKAKEIYKTALILKPADSTVLKQLQLIELKVRGVDTAQIAKQDQPIEQGAKQTSWKSKYDRVVADEYLKGFDVQKNSKWGYVNKDGKEILPIIYENIDPSDIGLGVSKGGKHGFMNKNGKEIIPLIYDDLWPRWDGLIYVKLNGKKGILNDKGQVIIPIKYDNLYRPVDGYVNVQLNNKCGVVDLKDNIIVPIIYSSTGLGNSEGYFNVWLNKKCGFYNTNGELVIPIIYHHAYPFKEGLAIASKDGSKWGYLDKAGRMVIPEIYDSAFDFKKGKAEVKLNGKTIYINKKGECIENCD
ncbi:MAG: WG repeat-containing protein [Chitinophagaceae bacterium]|nr:MAG: WG repeat-containing protein [Chitinophagaceae bacterium]